MKIYQGACHCKTVRFEVEGDLSRPMRCNCSICDQKGAIYLATGPAQLKITAGKEALSTYQFGTRTAKHHFCEHCGIHPFTNPRLDPRLWMVNIRCLENIEADAFEPQLFDGRNWDKAVKALTDSG